MPKRPVAPTNLNPPESSLKALMQPRESRIHDHGVDVNTAWWNANLRDHGLSGGPLRGSDPDAGVEAFVRVTRRQLFDLAAPVASGAATDEDVLRLLWHTLAWGSGPNRRQSLRRIKSFTEPSAVKLLREAGEHAAADTRTAYQMLIRRGGGVIGGFGPSFFTKYLYFAGAGRAEHPCVILDARVATALNRHGWTDLKAGWCNWYTDTYVSYCDLLRRWADEASCQLNRQVASDEFEIWLFKYGQ